MKRALFCFVIVFAAVLVFSGDALAGQFKTMYAIPNGGTIQAYSSPMPYGLAMEMEAFEFTSTTVTDNYRCRILLNRTNRPLNIRLIGVNATVINSCTAPVGGNCLAPIAALLPNLKFWCVVATQHPAPTALGGYYIMGVQRP